MHWPPLFARNIILVVTAVLSLCTGLLAQTQPAPEPLEVLQQLNRSLQSLVGRVCPAVVKIQVSTYGTDAGDDNVDDSSSRTIAVIKQHVSGSGVILDSAGYIVTNAHVVKDAKRIRVLLNPTTDSQSAATAILKGAVPVYTATLVGAHQDTDLAVLKIDATGLPTLRLATYEELRQGQLVVAVGSPLGMQNSVTMGIVSSVARQPEGERPVRYIQTDAPINPGSSGGALVNTSGDLVGITTLILEGESGGFALPSNTVRFVFDQLRRYGRVQHGDLGIRAQAITPALAAGLGLRSSSGVLVADVRPGSPADKIGLRTRDIIVTLDGNKVEDLSGLEGQLYLKAPGDRVAIQLLRGETVIDAKLSLEERKDEPNPESRPTNPGKSFIAEFGVFAIDVDKSLAESLPGIRDASGVLVSGKTALADNLDIDLLPGDVIHRLNSTTIRDMAGLRAEIKKLKAGDPIALQVERKRKFLYVAFEMD